MDIHIRGIKAFCCHAPTQHTKHKTTRVPPKKRAALCGLLNAYNVLRSYFERPAKVDSDSSGRMAADFTICREISRRFLCVATQSICHPFDRPPAQLFTWQCYIAKYP